MKLRKYTDHITNSAILSTCTYDPDWFPIWQDGQLQNKDEFIQLKMKEFSLKTPRIIIRALQSVGIE